MLNLIFSKSFHQMGWASSLRRRYFSKDAIPIEKIRNIGIIAHIDAGRVNFLFAQYFFHN